VSSTAGLVVAAGSGKRFGGYLPKAFVPLAGEPMFLWPLRAMEAELGRSILVVPAGYIEDARQICRHAGLRKVSDVVAGGHERSHSVFNGLCALQDDRPEIVAIHDGARPLLTPELIHRCISQARAHGAVVAAIPCTDTLKRTDAAGRILETPDRRQFWRAQTPQTFEYELIRQAYECGQQEGWESTDDASLVEALGHPVHVTEGDPHNIKVTTPADLLYAELLLSGGQQSFRIGHGFDVHPLVEGRPLILGGVSLDFKRGLVGHSDADVLFHAVSDALLGAIAAGDIGQHFPDTDPQYRNANSATLAQQVAEMLRQAGFEIVNVDATVVCEAPRLAPHIEQMRDNIARALGVRTEAVSVKATTTEGLGYTGRGEGIAAHAVAMVRAQRPA